MYKFFSKILIPTDKMYTLYSSIETDLKCLHKIHWQNAIIVVKTLPSTTFLEAFPLAN